MRLLLLAGLLLFAISAHAQLQDDFSDGNFTANPAWTGDAASFTINAANQLQSNGPAVTGTVLQLRTVSQAVTGTTWEFYARLAFATSSTNLADIYLISDSANFNGQNRGYFVRIGGTPDEVSLFRKDGTSTPVYVINGTDGTIGSTTNNVVKIRVTRSVQNLWTLEADYTGTGTSFVTEGTATDATYNRSGFFGVLLRYSSANNQKFYFDDFSITDNTAPAILSAQVDNPRQVTVTFNEPVAIATAENPARYSVNNGVGSPIDAVRDAANPAVVRLEFVNDLPSGNSTLTVTNMTDLYGNTNTTPQTAALNFTPPVIVQYRDIVINEVFADFSPQVGLPTAEFIELYNRSNKTINLAGWKYSDATTSAGTMPAYLLTPGSYVILTARADTSTYKQFGPTIGLTSWPALNDSGDDVEIFDNTGKLIDKISYTTAWYNDGTKTSGGWSLELINPTRPCSGPSNWAASVDPIGGTPGRENSIFTNVPDTQAPSVSGVAALSSTEIQVTFSEQLDSLSMLNGTYTVSNGISVTGKLVPAGNFRVVQLTVSPALTAGILYTLNISGPITDCSGNALPAGSFTFGLGATPGYQDLLITEIMADETPEVNLPAAEYVELHNPTNTIINLAGVKLSDGGTPAVLPAAVLLPGEYVIITATNKAALFTGLSRAIGVSNFPSLNNSGETLTLRSALNQLVFSVTYSQTWYKDPAKAAGGWSLEMIDVANPCAGIENWTASTDQDGGTPGRRNSVQASNPDNTAPRIVQAFASGANTLVIRFNEKLDSATAVNPAFFTFSSGLTATQVSVISPEFTTAEVILSGNIAASQTYAFTVNGIRDCAGNIASGLTGSFALPSPGQKGDIVINEILFNPRTGGVDFVELVNRSERHINLQGWKLGNFKADSTADIRTITNAVYVLAPGQLVLLTTNTDVVAAHYPQACTENFLRMTGFPSYPDASGVVTLLDPAEQNFDRVVYNANMHFELIDDKNGVSLERIRIDGPSTPANFHSAASTVGYATPGCRNSQVQNNVAGDKPFTISPLVFSPDEDGFNDFTTINFKLDQPGFTGSITVFDARGRQIKKLVQNQLFSTNGFYRWDGTTDTGSKATVGNYILLIELFDLNGKTKVYKERVVVGARF